MKASAVALTLLMAGTGAHAALSKAELSQVALSLPNEARLPLNLPFHDDAGLPLSFGDAMKGRPALVIPVDYTCKSTCGTALTLASDALADSGLKPNDDFRLVIVGIDPRDRPTDAHRMARAQIHSPEIATASSILLGDAATTHAFLNAIGYHALYDSTNDQFAHPAVVLAVTKDGRVSRALSSLAIDPVDLRLALIDAGEGSTGTFVDHIRSICYGFDAARGVYTPLVQKLLVATGLLTISLFGIFFVLLAHFQNNWLRRS
jgi:protein SCO1/2